MTPLELTVLILAGCLVAALVALAVLSRGMRGSEVADLVVESERRQRDATDRLAAMQAELAGRLGQLAEGQATAQARTSEQLQMQERELSRRLQDRLDALGRAVGETLEKTARRSETTMGELKQRLAVIDTAQRNITELSSQVVGLQDILSNKQARGQFGEIQLNDLVSQTLPPSAYRFQAPVGENRRADCLLALPNPPGAIAIDAKFPLEAFQALREAPDDAGRATARKRLAGDLAKHVRDIASKYIVPGETADQALMFLPSEALYAELHANMPGSVQDAFRAKVWIVSPTTLMATLTTVRAILKDARMRDQAHVIQAEVEKLLGDVDRLDERVGNLDRHFAQASDDLRQIRISTEKVTKRGERIREVEVGDLEVGPDGSPQRIEAAE